MKRYLVTAACVIAGLLCYAVSSVIVGIMSLETLAWIVLLNAIGLVALWRNTEPRRPRPGKEFFKSLLDSKPIEPMHQTPKSIGDDSWHISDHDKIFFHDFEHFSSNINKVLEYESPWRIQELSDTRLMHTYSLEYPKYGRRYAIYHNQVRVGELEIQALHKYSHEKPRVRTWIQLNYVRLIDAGELRGFIYTILQDVSDSDEERFQINTHIQNAMLTVLWGNYRVYGGYNQNDVEDLGELNISFESTAYWTTRTQEERDEYYVEIGLKRRSDSE